jgi:hypothetical protein
VCKCKIDHCSYACISITSRNLRNSSKQPKTVHTHLYVREETGGIGDLGLSAETALRSLFVLRSKSVNFFGTVAFARTLRAAGGLGRACCIIFVSRAQAVKSIISHIFIASLSLHSAGVFSCGTNSTQHCSI